MAVNEHGRTIQHYTQTGLKVKAQLVVRKDMDANKHGRAIRHYTQTQLKVKAQLVVKKGYGCK